MKVELEKHISEVLSALQIVGHFEVYDCRVDVMPEWVNKIPITHEFLVSFGQLSSKEKLSFFLQKEIFKNGDRLYWFDVFRFRLSMRHGGPLTVCFPFWQLDYGNLIFT